MQNEEIRQFLIQAKDSKFYLAYLLSLTTGMRRGKILALRRQDVDLNNNQVSVNQSLVRFKEGGLIFQEPNTKLAKRTINISSRSSKLLQEHQEKLEEIRKSEGINYRSDLDLIFCN